MEMLVTDLEQLGQTTLQEFGREVAQTKTAPAPDMELLAHRLEAKLEQLYAVAVTMARREESLEGVAAIWAGMVAICDGMAKALSEALPTRSPRSTSYDRILDIRNVCEENRALHA
jgi:hypothetical protein